MDRSSPIGIFDSGIGGISVFKQVRALLPQEDIVYFGDTKRIPYGPRPPAEIRAFAGEILRFMQKNGVKAAVAACNTITVNLGDLPLQFPFPIIGMDMGIEAARRTKTGKIGVIATAATIASGRHAAELSAAAPAVKVYPQACPEFAPLVEAEQYEGAAVERPAARYLTPLREAGVDVVLLACTHYSYLLPVIQKAMGGAVLADPAEATARRLREVLAAAGLLNEAGQGRCRLYFSAGLERARRIAGRLCDVERCECARVDLADVR